MRCRLLFLFLMLLSIGAAASEKEVSPVPSLKNTVLRLSYRQCLDLALKNADKIRSADMDIRLSQAKEEEAHPGGIPVVRYEYRLAPVPRDLGNAAESFFGGDLSILNAFKVEMGAPISSFGKIQTAQDLAALGVRGSRLKKLRVSDDIAVKIFQTYNGILLANELLNLAEQAQTALTGKVDDLEKEQTRDQVQILKLKVATYEVDRKVGDARKKKELAYSALKMLMGLESDVNLQVAESTLVPLSFHQEKWDAYLAKAKGYRPEYKLLETGVAAKEKQLRLEKLSSLPNLGVGGFFDIGRAPGIRGDENDTSFTNPFNYTKAGVGFQLKGEFDYVKSKAKKKQAEADYLKTIYDKREAVKGLETDIKKSYLDMLEAEDLKEKVGQEKKAARQIVFLTKSNMDIGVGEKKDYYDSLQSYLVMQGREFEAIYNYNVAVCELKKKIGLYIWE